MAGRLSLALRTSRMERPFRCGLRRRVLYSDELEELLSYTLEEKQVVTKCSICLIKRHLAVRSKV